MPNRPNRLLLLVTLLATALAGAVAADEPAAKPGAGKDRLVETNHTVTLNGNKLEYTATAGTLPLRNDEGKVTARVFFVAYTKTGVTDASVRPITFAFNGGPGSSAVWLHLGGLGPRRVQLGPDGELPPPPFRLADNPWTILDMTDLVFIDPVSTGFSRAEDEKDAKQFHGVQPDLEAVGEFIRLYLTRFQRWGSPKFLAGESYGSTRAAGLAGYLHERHGIDLNGVILISAVLNFQTIRFDEGNDLPYVLFLPAYTATAWYHKKLPPELQGDLRSALAAAEQFAVAEYSVALLKGGQLTADEQRQIARKLARFTGLSEDYILRANLRIGAQRFMKELLRSARRTVGRFDSRFTGTDSDAVGEVMEYDASYAAVQGPYTAALNQYIRGELKYESDLPYEILTGKVQPWDYGAARNRYLNMTRSLRLALVQNPHLRVFVASGYYDLATPYFAMDYTIRHLGLDPSQRDRVTTAYYEAGHMMYIHQPSQEKLKRDLAAFIASSVPHLRPTTGGR